MIASDYLRTMARYNRWQNASLFCAAARLDEAERRADRGAFFGSIHATLSHIYWADTIWLSRFDLIEPPDVPQSQSGQFIEDFAKLNELRGALDNRIVEFCDAFQSGPVSGDLEWFSGSVNRNVKAPLAMVFTHFFNHQTHHRGQTHAMLTATGASMPDTDLFLMPAELWPE